MRLKGRLIPVSDLSAGRRDEMFALMERHYENMARSAFERDLESKDWVIELTDPRSGELCGFSTQVLMNVNVDGQPINVLYSGDTVVSREHWGDTALSHVWGCLALRLIDSLPAESLYWFLLSKGYKTYRFLPLFFHEFYPRHDVPTPEWARRIRDVLGQDRYPHDYDAGAGIVRAGPGKDRLRQGIADVTAERLRDAHVAFFARQNPGHLRGEELCCLAPLTRTNFTRAAYRVIGPEPAALETSA
jgi:hypothetical protein